MLARLSWPRGLQTPPPLRWKWCGRNFLFLNARNGARDERGDGTDAAPDRRPPTTPVPGACRRHPVAAAAAPRAGQAGLPSGGSGRGSRRPPLSSRSRSPRCAPASPRRHVTRAHARRPGAHLQADVSGPRAVPRARLPRLPRCRRARLGPAPAARGGGLGLLQPNFPESFLLCLPPLCSPSLSPLSVSRSPLPPNSDDIHMVFCTEEAAQEEGTHPHPNISLFFPPSSSPPPFFLLERQNVQGDSLGELMASFLLPSQPVF